MKKALILISFILAAVASFSFRGVVGKLPTNTVDTFINKQSVGSATTLYYSKGGIQGDSALVLPKNNFADTTAANFSRAAGYAGSLILVGSDVWVRLLNPGRWIKFATSSGGGYVLISDTALMLTPYLRKSDTAFMLSTRVKYSDTAYQMSGYVRKGYPVLYTDSANMLSPYLRKTDTVSMLVPYVRNNRTINTNAPLFGGGDLSANRTFGIDTGRANAQIPSGGDLNKVRDSLVSLISGGGFGTVLNVSTTDGIGIVSSVANPTSTPNISIRVDTVSISTRAWRQKGDDSLGGLIALKVNISDTATMLNPYLRKSDTATMLAPFVQYSDTAAMLSNRLKISDTATMLSNRLKISDTAYMLSNRLKISDTATMLTGYTRVQRFLDTTLVLRTLINTKGTGTVTSVALSLPAMFSVSGSPVTTSGTLTASLANQTANTVFSGPSTGSPAQPTFRSLVAADIPDLSASYIQNQNSTTQTANFTISGVGTSTNFVSKQGVGAKTFTMQNTSGIERWTFLPLNNEMGSGDIGYDMILGSYTDAGVFKSNVVTFRRSSGSASFIDSVIANSYRVMGGASTSFLKADGSLDNNTYATTAQLALKLNISDTSTMISPYLRKSDTATMLAPFVQYSDTASILSGYTRLTRFSDSLTAIRGRINGAGTLSTAAQPNITSVGTLTNLTVTGDTKSGTFSIGDWQEKITTGHIDFDYSGSNKFRLRNDGILQSKYAYEAYLDGSNTFGLGAYSAVLNSAGTRGWFSQLNASNNLDFWYFNGTSGSTKQTFTNDGAIKTTRVIGNGGADNTIDAIQSGGGSTLSNLYRMEGKVQATSTTIDATATVWNDNTNGSTVTYTLPSTSSLQGGLFMFVKTGTGNLTLSGTIVKSDGSSVGSMTLASTDGLNQFWFNGTTWYQVK